MVQAVNDDARLLDVEAALQLDVFKQIRKDLGMPKPPTPLAPEAVSAASGQRPPSGGTAQALAQPAPGGTAEAPIQETAAPSGAAAPSGHGQRRDEFQSIFGDVEGMDDGLSLVDDANGLPYVPGRAYDTPPLARDAAAAASSGSLVAPGTPSVLATKPLADEVLAACVDAANATMTSGPSHQSTVLEVESQSQAAVPEVGSPPASGPRG